MCLRQDEDSPYAIIVFVILSIYLFVRELTSSVVRISNIGLLEGGFLERRFYFLAGDALSNGIMGMGSAWLAIAIVDPTWHMLAAMLAGMAAGMGLSLILMPLFVGLFGAMEVMLPVMLTAMLAGMAFGMMGAMYVLTALEVLLGGGLTGILVLMLTYAVDAGMHRRKL